MYKSEDLDKLGVGKKMPKGQARVAAAA